MCWAAAPSERMAVHYVGCDGCQPRGEAIEVLGRGLATYFRLRRPGLDRIPKYRDASMRVLSLQTVLRRCSDSHVVARTDEITRERGDVCLRTAARSRIIPAGQQRNARHARLGRPRTGPPNRS